jgi:polar amino acid transport system permease protein
MVKDIFLTDLLDQMPLIIDGLVQTILLTITISATGFLAGIGVFYLCQHRNRVLSGFAAGYTSFFVGMPLIVLLFLMYYGLPNWGVRLSPFAVAVIGFTFNVGAYNATYMMTAYYGMDRTERDAAAAQGFTDLQVFRYVVLPQVLRLSVPALTNQIIRNLKDSSLAFLIQYTEFFARVQELASGNFQFFKAYLFAAVVYLILVSVVVIAGRVLESRWRLGEGNGKIT